MDQLIEQRESGQFGFSETGVDEHWCYYYWRSHIQETNHYSGNNSHPNRERPPDAIRLGLCRVPLRLVPATGVRAALKAAVA